MNEEDDSRYLTNKELERRRALRDRMRDGCLNSRSFELFVFVISVVVLPYWIVL